MKTRILIAAFGLTLAACAPMTLSLPSRFAALETRGDYRARYVTPDGVVVSARALDQTVRGGLEFWGEAVVRRLRDQEGYELLSEAAVTAANGASGHRYRFGRDLEGHAYRYTITVFLSSNELWLFEAGGRTASYEPLEAEVERAIDRAAL
jgi:hypothetical protein